MIELLKILLSTILNVLWCLVKVPFLIVIGVIGTAIGGSETPLITSLINAVSSPIKCLWEGFSEMASCVSNMLGNKIETSVRKEIAEKRNDKYQ